MSNNINRLRNSFKSRIQSIFSKIKNSPISRITSKVTKIPRNYLKNSFLTLKGLKVTLIIIFAITMFALAIPEFKVKIGDNEFIYPSIGFSRIGIPVDYPSFTQGKGIFGSKEFKAEFNFSSTELREDQKSSAVSRTLEIIRDRINFSGFADIEVTSQKINSNYYLNLKIPNNYVDAEQYARWLTGRGIVSFENLQLIGEEFSENPILINDTDIVNVFSELNVRYTTQVRDANGNNVSQIQGIRADHLVFRIDKSKSAEITKLSDFVNYATTVQSGKPYLSNIVFDGSISLNIFKDDFDDSIIRAFPQGRLTSVTARDQMKVIKSYFRSSPLNVELNISDEKPSTSIPPIYNPEGGTVVAIGFMIGFVVIAVDLARRFGLRKSSIILGVWTYTILTTINFAKLLILPINLGTVLGFGIFGLLLMILITKLFHSDKENFKNFRSAILQIMIIMLFVIAGITSSTYSVENIKEFTSVMIAFMLVLIPLLYTVYEFTFNNLVRKNEKN